MKDRKITLTNILLSVYGILSEVHSKIEDVEEQAKFQNILNKVEKKALAELVSLTSDS